MNNTGTVTIALNKQKLYKLVILSTVFLMLGCWMLQSADDPERPFFGVPVIKDIVAGGCLLLSLVGLATGLFSLLGSERGVLIDDQGITDRSSLAGAGRIPWGDVQLLITATIVNRPLLLLMVKNPEQYIRRQRNLLLRKIMQMNYRQHGTPVCIAASRLACSVTELEGLVESRLAGYKGKGVRVVEN
ncbi:STM3941 family protein [Chitinophaga japonensis]|uniref:Uncharacterized protein n=1 Tax=Chitinophaga japonensis TaxID=104662 RepID=A0A562SZ58_CHIJA|nr:STM3941 family protein [Chitinophaga japonensis]TWI86589.1 hypothetical protein LX66_3848 [Chitinophaga japonensis]